MRMRGKKDLSIAGLLAATFLLALSFSSASPNSQYHTAKYMLANAAVGISASVPPNPYNTLAMELAQKEEDLREREARLAALEAAARDAGEANSLALYALGISVTLLVLVGINFLLDWRRGRRRVERPLADMYSVNLKR